MNNQETKAKFTPGLWQVHPDQKNIVAAPYAGYFVADTFAHHDSHANAILIAAAPELLDNLILAEDWLQGIEINDDPVNQSALRACIADIRAVIAKATGAA